MKKTLRSISVSLIAAALFTVSISPLAVQAEPLPEKPAAVETIQRFQTESEMKEALRKANAELVEAAVNEALAETNSEEDAQNEKPSGLRGQTADLSDAAETASGQLEALFTTVDLMDATISELQEEMQAGHLTSAQLTQMYIDRINAYDEELKLNSVISINPDALNDALGLDQERREGTVRGPLHGIPIIVKANYDVAGMATSAGSNALANMIVPEDAFTVKKLKDAGAVIIAQANMSEFAFSALDSVSTLGGVVRNPYDESKSPAGSSGGTGVAVTSNFAAAGLGTDTGGSIRNPSSFCNLYGIRPSKGLTSIDGVFPMGASRDTTGPMARTAEDMTLLLQTLAGCDAADDYTIEADADALVGDGYMDSLTTDGLKGKRIGYLPSSFFYETYSLDEQGKEVVEIIKPDLKVQAMMKKAMANMVKAGAVFVDISKYITDEMVQKYYFGASEATSEYDINKYLYEKGDTAHLKTLKEIVLSGQDVMYSNFDIDPKLLADSFETTENPYTTKFGDFLRTPSWKTTLDGRAEVSEILEKNNIDAVIYLSYFDAPPALPLEKWHNTGAQYPYVFGPALGMPEIMLPMGFSDTDKSCTTELPLGISIFSGFGKEETLTEIAYAYEQQAGSYIRRMPSSVPALEDPELNAFLADLMDEVYSIDYSKYKTKPEGKVQLMLNACEKAKNVNTKDPYATYEAARALASAYDSVMASLEASGPAAVKTDVKKCSIRLSKTQYTYNGQPRKPSVTVKDGETKLTAGADYRVFYDNNTDAGTASVIIKGIGNYTGTAAKTFKILPLKTEPAVTLSKVTFVYNGKVQTPAVKVKADSEILTDEDYDIAYDSGRKNVGTYKVTVKLKNNYSGSITVSYKIIPKGTTVSKLTPASKAFTVSWKKQTTQTSGYQIQYSTSSTFKSGNKTVTVTPNSIASKKITKLEAKKKYYVRVRTFKTAGGKKYYSGWSDAKAVTTR